MVAAPRVALMLQALKVDSNFMEAVAVAPVSPLKCVAPVGVTLLS
jgi:hypothetical protein